MSPQSRPLSPESKNSIDLFASEVGRRSDVSEPEASSADTWLRFSPMIGNDDGGVRRRYVNQGDCDAHIMLQGQGDPAYAN
jgi:hypothetical protein